MSWFRSCWCCILQRAAGCSSFLRCRIRERSINSWLVVSNMASMFHKIWDVILPIDELIFFRMVKITDQIVISNGFMVINSGFIWIYDDLYGLKTRNHWRWLYTYSVLIVINAIFEKYIGYYIPRTAIYVSLPSGYHWDILDILLTGRQYLENQTPREPRKRCGFFPGWNRKAPRKMIYHSGT